MERRSSGRGLVKPLAGVLLTAYCLLPTAITAWADEPATAGMKAEIEILKERLAKLESQVAEPSTGGGGSAGISLPSGLKGVQMSGFVDTSMSLNFNTPGTRTNTLRVFDTQSNSFMLNNTELVLEKPVSSDSRLGFRTDLDFGTDSKVIGAVTSGLGRGDDELDIQQAYAEYLAPLGNGLDIKAGKFVTLVGAEVIESKDNWNFSRSYLFGFAEPATHTGLRMSYPFSDRFTAIAGLNNGWDVVDDNNSGKSFELSFSAVPCDKTSLATTYFFGPEQTTNSAQPASGTFGSNTHTRHLIDVVAGYQPIDALQLKMNFDYGFEEKGVGIGKPATWSGIAGYARYAINDWWAIAGRTEWFHDADGVRTAFRPTGSGTFGVGSLNGISGLDLKLWEWTITNEFKLNKHLTGRLEYRHDQASEHVFRRNDLGQRPYQDTVSAEVIMPF